MALTAANVTSIENLHGPDNLYQWTNPHGADENPASTVTAVLQTAVDACVTALNKRGYSFAETDPVVFTYCVCFLRPAMRDDDVKALLQEMERLYPFKKSGYTATNAVAPSDSTSVSKFDDANWDGLKQIGNRRRGFSNGGW